MYRCTCTDKKRLTIATVSVVRVTLRKYMNEKPKVQKNVNRKRFYFISNNAIIEIFIPIMNN